MLEATRRMWLQIMVSVISIEYVIKDVPNILDSYIIFCCVLTILLYGLTDDVERIEEENDDENNVEAAGDDGVVNSDDDGDDDEYDDEGGSEGEETKSSDISGELF